MPSTTDAADGGGGGKKSPAAAGGGQQQREQREAEEAAAVRAVENVGVALDNISAQLEPLFAVPWDTLVSRWVVGCADRLCVWLCGLCG
jgi:hypothetical protein